MISFIEVTLGKSTKIEPIVNPIILKNVCVWNLSNNSLISFMQQIDPKIKPTANGNKKGIYKEEIDKMYASYTPRSIKINVLLTPGIITPADIKNPENIKYIKLKWFTLFWKLYLFSIYTRKIPIQNEIIK